MLDGLSAVHLSNLVGLDVEMIEGSILDDDALGWAMVGTDASMHSALFGESATFYGDGRQSRDFTYVGTICEVFLDALRRSVHRAHPVYLGRLAGCGRGVEAGSVLLYRE